MNNNQETCRGLVSYKYNQEYEFETQQISFLNALHNVTKAILQSDAQSKCYLWEIKVLRVLKAGLPWCVYIIFLTRISIYLFKLKKVIILLNWSKHLLGFNQQVGNETTYLMKKLTWSVKSFR